MTLSIIKTHQTTLIMTILDTNYLLYKAPHFKNDIPYVIMLSARVLIVVAPYDCIAAVCVGVGGYRERESVCVCIRERQRERGKKGDIGRGR